ncbi:MAG TPA: hypothetical protein VGM88_04300 [Kofleriaceae bacterium]
MTNTLDEDTAVDPPLVKLLSQVPDEPAPAGWEDKVRDAFAAAPRRRSRALAYAGATAVALTAIFGLVFALHGGGRRRDIEIEPLNPDGTRMMGPNATIREVTIRHHLKVTIADDAVALRVYQDGLLLTQCPGGPGCEGKVLSIPKLSAGKLYVVAFYGDQVLPSTGRFAKDLDQPTDRKNEPYIQEVRVR